MASATSEGSPRIRVMPAVCIATSVPVAMAIPMFAAASAGASLIPSPTIATRTPPFWNSATIAALPSGRTSARTSGIPSSRATALALPVLSPVTSAVRMPAECSASTAFTADGLMASPKDSMPTRVAAPSVTSAIQDTVRPSRCSSWATWLRVPRSTLNSLIHRGLPSRSSRPSTVPAMPRPGLAFTLLAGASVIPDFAAASMTARAKGCSLPTWSDAAATRKSLLSPVGTLYDSKSGRPSVSVPVLSKTTILTACAVSSASASLMRMPRCAAAPVPTMIAVGVASPNAHGHAMTNTATAWRMATGQLPVPNPHPRSVTIAMANTTGTKTALTRSTMR